MRFKSSSQMHAIMLLCNYVHAGTKGAYFTSLIFTLRSTTKIGSLKIFHCVVSNPGWHKLIVSAHIILVSTEFVQTDV